MERTVTARRRDGGPLVPYTRFKAGTSPFVTFFASVGVPGAGTIMNIVVLTAAFSSLKAGLYSTGRILRSMSMNGSAPAFTGRMSRNGVPFGGILLTGAVTLLRVVLNAFKPGEAFEIVLNISALGIIASWGTIVLCQLQLFRWSRKGLLERPRFMMIGAPWTGYLCLASLFTVLVLIGFDQPIGTWTLATLVVIIPMLIGGWFVVRKRVLAVANERMGYTGEFPVVANRPRPGAEA